jgi:protein O-GlcNAc transferase
MTRRDPIDPNLITSTLQKAHADHQAGRFDDAEKAYGKVLSQQPDQPDALHLLGVVAYQTGRHTMAAELLKKAIAVQPDIANFHNNLGNVFRATGDLDGAVASYRRALELEPRNASAQCNLGVVFFDRGDLPAATEAFRKALEIDPNAVDALINLGAALGDGGDFEQAIEQYEKALSINPRHPEAWNNLAGAYRKTRAFDKSQAALQKAIALRPNDASYHASLGNILRDQGKAAQAKDAFFKAIELDSDAADAHNNLGTIFKDQNELERAITSFRAAITVRPDFTEALANLGNTYKEGGQVDQALDAYGQAINTADSISEVRSGYLLCLNYSTKPSPAEVFFEHKKWAQCHAHDLARDPSSYSNDRNPARPLRVGYISPDLHTHSVAFFIEALLSAHSPDAVQIICFADIPRPDAMTERLQRHGHEWRDIFGKSDSEVALEVRRENIDILVDLSGHTARNRLLAFARKPAPVQVSYLGYCNTSGLSAMDYRLTDHIADPEDADDFYTEQLVRLPRCFLGYTPVADAPDIAPLPAATNDHITFGSFNNIAKVTPEVIAVWAAILSAVPNSRMLLKFKALQDPPTRERIAAAFEGNGIARDRITFAGRLPTKLEHLTMYGGMDVALDPFPYNGTTTTCEALWMGVPVIALKGQRHAGRVGASLLSAVGLDELIAPSIDAYIAKAVQLAADRHVMAALRKSLRDRMAASALCDATGLARAVEGAYRGMWRKWCAS